MRQMQLEWLTKGIRNEIHSLGIMMHFRVETGEVEAVEDVFLVDFAKVFVALCA